MNREIPHNIDAEQSVLGSMFLTKKALQKALELLDGSEFYLDNHSKIFECIKSIDARGSVVDLTTVADELNNRNWLKQIVEELKSKGYEIDKKQIKIDGSISSLGFHTVDVELHKKVVAKLKIELKK